jgi:flavin-dependent dehydrogenase
MSDGVETQSRDLLVVGGGSAGMAAAISGAIRGLRVTVFDAAGDDFDKPCGEGLMPTAVFSLKGLGVKIPEFASLAGVAYISSSGKKKIEAPFSDSHFGMGVRRRVLRKALWSRARQLGVEIIEGRVDAVHESDVEISIGSHRAPWVCVATGSRDRLLKGLGLQDARSKKQRPSRTGLRRHAKLRPWSDLVEVYWSDDAELYVTPVGPQLVNIAILSWRAVSFEEALAWFPAVSSRLKNVEWEDAVVGVSPMAHRGRVIQRRRIFLAGDAAGFLDAMTGEGNALAIQSGIAVSQSIDTLKRASGLNPDIGKSPARMGSLLYAWLSKSCLYRILWLKIIWRYWLVTSLALKVSRPGVSRKIGLRIVFRWPWILRFGVRFLSVT